MNVVDPKKALFTALTRDGLYMVKNGQISHAVKNMRFTESMLNAFNKVTAVSKDRKKVPGFFGVSYVPALKIEDFHFTGKTE
jgi:predicted Zn-dependent protease